jgi:hypothetical protein
VIVAISMNPILNCLLSRRLQDDGELVMKGCNLLVELGYFGCFNLNL